MRNLIAIALGLLLLVSAAAATGNNNNADVDVSVETSDNCITGANVAQLTNLDANLLGNHLDADQTVDIEIEDSSLTGMGKQGCDDDSSLSDGKTNAIQSVDLMLNSTGCDNYDSQYVEFAQGENCVTIGNITQQAVLGIDDIGNNNCIDQDSYAFAGVWEEGESGCEFGSPNDLTNSNLKQVQVEEACVTGNENDVDQTDLQFATDNCLTNSKLYEQVALETDVLGCDNDVDQIAIQVADNNDLTDSWANKIICEDAQVTGNDNDVDQFAFEENLNNCLTLSTELQRINEFAAVLGCDNNVDQDVSFQSDDNEATGGHIVQETTVNTDV